METKLAETQLSPDEARTSLHTCLHPPHLSHKRLLTSSRAS